MSDRVEIQSALEFALSQEFDDAITKWVEAVPDPQSFLQQQGVQLPEDTTVTVQQRPSSGIGAESRVCWEVCFGPSWAQICREKCTGKP